MASVVVRRVLSMSELRWLALALLALTVAFGAAVARAEPLPEAEVVAVVRQAFPPRELARAVTVARCESTFDPAAVSAGYDRRLGVWYDHRGLFQIEANVWHWLAENIARALRHSVVDLFDAETNAHVAAAVLRIQGWSAWPWCGR